MLRAIAFFVVCSTALAQSKQQSPTPAEVLVPNLPAQVIGPDDMILLSVYDSPEFSRTIRVGSDGMIRLPMLKQKVRAEGLLPNALEASVAKALVDEQLLVDPMVTVTITEYHSRPISVVGAVKNPITFQAAGMVTLIDALTRAGGLTDEAEGEILVSRTAADQKTQLTQRISVRLLIDNPDPELNLRLTGGEEIRVPVAPKITVAGNVKKPGSYPLKENSEMTVMKAIALAEGVQQFWANKAYIYRSDDTTGKKNAIEIPLKEIINRKSEDVPLVARDVLFIPDSTGKRTFEKALGVATGTASGLIVFH
jgi:polysaccharide export outer membrane protein